MLDTLITTLFTGILSGSVIAVFLKWHLGRREREVNEHYKSLEVTIKDMDYRINALKLELEQKKYRLDSLKEISSHAAKLYSMQAKATEIEHGKMYDPVFEGIAKEVIEFLRSFKYEHFIQYESLIKTKTSKAI